MNCANSFTAPPTSQGPPAGGVGNELLAGHSSFRVLPYLPLLRASDTMSLTPLLAKLCGGQSEKAAHLLGVAGPRDALGLATLFRHVFTDHQVRFSRAVGTTHRSGATHWPRHFGTGIAADRTRRLPHGNPTARHRRVLDAWAVEMRVPYVDVPFARTALAVAPRRGVDKRRFTTALGHAELRFLNGLSVGEAFRGQGYGRHLLLDGIAMAEELGIGALVLDVARHNLSVIALSRRSGFVDVGASAWADLTDHPADGAGYRARVVDWPTFQAQREVYGFGDLKIRNGAGTVTSVRLVGNAMRAGWDHIKVPMPQLRALLGASRVYAVSPADASWVEQPFVYFIRMRRRVSKVAQR
jgi:ribosomal protein S18 acetylase RimI-like enzyme